jgi:hypothetical protein
MMAKGGEVDDAYRIKLSNHIYKTSLSKDVNGFKLVKEGWGNYGFLIWVNKQMPNIEIYATPFFTPDHDINFEEVVNDETVRSQDKSYKLTGDLDKDEQTYFEFLESKTKKYAKGKMEHGGDLTGNPMVEKLEKELEQKNKELDLVYAEYWSMKAGDDFETNAKKKYKLQQEVEALEREIHEIQVKEGKKAQFEFEHQYPVWKNGNEVGTQFSYLTVWAVNKKDAFEKAMEVRYKNGALPFSRDEVKRLTDYNGNKLDPSYQTPEDHVVPYSEEILKRYEKGYEKYENKNKKQKVDEDYREQLKDYILYKYSKKYIDNYKLIPVSPEEGSPYVWKLKGKKIEILFDPFYETENEIVVNVYKNEDDLLEQTDIKYKLTGYLEKDSEKYIELLKPYFVKYSGKMAKGGKLVGKQKNLDVNKNGKLDAEDFKMLRKGKK